ncbi:MAG: flagellar basal body L-ring protein FlgH [Halothiobacillaceae bacterium]|jgi:flagellar L-ring protein precursor FlgH|nr:flagellar basal body L-ring protein FlgH [Halothiobacillaceae bacterium]MDY0050243.1 flagellar basal body L-ring protein FlgH [Halothiobacillaceae bacterium]
MNTQPALRTVCILTLALGLGACASQPPVQSDPAFAAVLPQEPLVATPAQINGAIFNPVQADSLFTDMRPYRVGDILTVLLSEQTNASKSATTSTGKSQSVDVGVTRLLNVPIDWANAGIEGERDFKGTGDSSQKNNLSGNITVTVARVLPNGNLMIQGEKFLSLNQGTEFVRLSGIVRPSDIKPDNTVESTRVANARIAYGSDGVINDANNMGWLARFFNSPYMPF